MGPKPRSHGPHPKMAAYPLPPQQHSDTGRSGGELRALDRNLSAQCVHVQTKGFNSGSFSDITVHAMGSTYRLHRLILSRSSYFRNMLGGPWKEAGASVVTVHFDDKNVNPEAIATSFAYLYGQQPKLNVDNAFRVLAAASFLDLQDLCAICTDFIIPELCASNFSAYQDYGIHGEHIRNACRGCLHQSGAMDVNESDSEDDSSEESDEEPRKKKLKISVNNSDSNDSSSESSRNESESDSSVESLILIGFSESPIDKSQSESSLKLSSAWELSSDESESESSWKLL